MDLGNCDLAKQWVSASYINQGAQALAARRKRIKALLSSRRLPEQGWDEATIEMLVQVCGQELLQTLQLCNICLELRAM
jgi:O-phospho-L-seryl-tRNASec:L-selenocysteinyl-tRNA synthase